MFELTPQQELILALVSIPVVIALCFLYVRWLLIKYYSDDVIYQYAQLGTNQWNWEITTMRGRYWKQIVRRIEKKVGEKLEVAEESIEQSSANAKSTIWVVVKIRKPSMVNRKVRKLRT